MYLSQISYLGVSLAAVASFMLGWLWYSPLLFGKPWMAAKGLTAKQIKALKNDPSMGMSMVVSFLASWIQAFMLAQLLAMTLQFDLKSSLILTCWLWLGFVTVTQITQMVYGHKKLQLYLLDTFYQLASMLAMAVVLNWI